MLLTIFLIDNTINHYHSYTKYSVAIQTSNINLNNDFIRISVDY